MKDTAAWRALEDRFTRALTTWGFTRDAAEAKPYARAIVRNLKAEGWRTPLPPGSRMPQRPAWHRRAKPEAVTAYAAAAREEIRRQRQPVET